MKIYKFTNYPNHDKVITVRAVSLSDAYEKAGSCMLKIVTITK